MKYNITFSSGQSFETNDPIKAFAAWFAEEHKVPIKDRTTFIDLCYEAVMSIDGPICYGHLFDLIAHSWRKHWPLKRIVEEYFSEVLL